MKIENIEIKIAKKFNKKRINKYERERTTLFDKFKIEKNLEKDELIETLNVNPEASMELMALTAICFLSFYENEQELTFDEAEKFLDEDVDFQELAKIGELAEKAFSKFQETLFLKKKLQKKLKKN